MKLTLNLLNGIYRPGRDPRAQDPRILFPRQDQAFDFWFLHKRILAAINQWRREFTPPPARVPFADLLPDIQSFGRTLAARLADNRSAYSRIFAGISDAAILLEESLHPAVFAAYVKAQIVRPLKEVYAAGSGLDRGSLRRLIDLIETALDP